MFELCDVLVVYVQWARDSCHGRVCSSEKTKTNAVKEKKDDGRWEGKREKGDVVQKSGDEVAKETGFVCRQVDVFHMLYRTPSSPCSRHVFGP